MLLRAASVLALAVACSTAKPDGDAPNAGEAGSANAGTPSFAGESGSSAEGGAGSWDTAAAYAHVTAVSATGNDGAYTFSVSVESADIDCTQFADFWEVLGEDGSLLYRRILEHSHTDENGTTDADAPGNTFTRDGGPVVIEASRIVIVRAHMNTTGYNGRALRGSVATGFDAAPDIDSHFAAEIEDDMPLPSACSF